MTTAVANPNMRWVLLDGSWHELENTWIFGNGWLVKTACCGITRSWDQTFLDRLPGGDERVCDRVGAPPEDSEVDPAPPKRTRKSK